MTVGFGPRLVDHSASSAARKARTRSKSSGARSPVRITGTNNALCSDRDSGASIVDAVGASCAVPGVWPPVTIGGRRYIDGGVRSATNADLAAGCSKVVIIAPVSLGGKNIPRVSAQAEALRAGGASVIIIVPDAAAKQAIGRNVLDPARRPAAARAGRTQAATIAERVAEVWG